ncbi:MAG: hypothetical protein IH809_06375 [Proteobacteria bacterium]|nr:hypothetical protein [Pseudomonadota bacterium]
MPTVLPDILSAALAADKKRYVGRLYALASFTRLGGLLQSTDGELSVNPGFRRDGNNRILLSLPLVTMHEDGDADCRKTGEQPVAGDVRRPFADLRNPSSRG